MDGQGQFAYKVLGDDSIVGGVWQARELWAIGGTWELVTNEEEAGHTSVDVDACQSQGVIVIPAGGDDAIFG